jgi:pescadillo protein
MRKLKAGKRGLVTKYITRSKAIRKLQLSLKDFRRLCILKGIYPREPPQKLKKLNKTYYHTKDINFLSADTLIDRFRQQKIWLRKYKHARAKGMTGQVRFMKNRKPKYNLTHLIRERYPEFTDALRDLDDPLSLIALFSIFPSHK